MIFFLGGVIAHKEIKKAPYASKRLAKNYKFIICIFIGLVILETLFYLLVLDLLFFWLAQLFVFWIFQAFLLFITCNFWLKDENIKSKKRITVDHLEGEEVDFKTFEKALESKDSAPIGANFVKKELVSLPVSSRTEHLLVTGATGTGKTTLMMNLLRHSFLHKHPLVILDPKGEIKDIEMIKFLFCELGRKEEDFKLFSLAQPEKSLSYDPLKYGTSEQVRSKLMLGLSFTHDYYASQASQYLSILLSCFEALKKKMNLKELKQALNNSHKEFMEKKELEGMEDDVASLSQIKKEDLAGLKAQVEILNSREFSHLLSSSKCQIDLVEILEKGQVAYFQLNTNGYGDFARRLGKMIVQDLKVISSQIHAGQIAPKFNFAGIFIDEFGSFATRDFSDLLKMIRSSNIGVHLFCQGLADLKAVSSEFSDQILGNTAYKLIFRQDVPQDCETWSSVCGTIEDKAMTFQVSSQEMLSEFEKTGLGSLFNTKKMKVDFDVFKSLKRGQALLIDKLQNKQILLQVYNAKEKKKKGLEK